SYLRNPTLISYVITPSLRDALPISGNAHSESQTLRLLGGPSIAGASILCPVSLGDSDGLDGHLLLRRTVAGPGVRALGGDIGDVLRAGLLEGSEHGVVGRQGTVVVYDEELGDVGVGTGVGHGQCAGRVGLGAVELIGERVAGATAAGSGRITALEDEDALGGQAVAVGVVEILLPGQGQEAVDGAGCALGVE